VSGLSEEELAASGVAKTDSNLKFNAKYLTPET